MQATTHASGFGINRIKLALVAAGIVVSSVIAIAGLSQTGALPGIGGNDTVSLNATAADAQQRTLAMDRAEFTEWQLSMAAAEASTAYLEVNGLPIAPAVALGAMHSGVCSPWTRQHTWRQTACRSRQSRRRTTRSGTRSRGTPASATLRPYAETPTHHRDHNRAGIRPVVVPGVPVDTGLALDHDWSQLPTPMLRLPVHARVSKGARHARPGLRRNRVPLPAPAPVVCSGRPTA